MQKIIFSLIMLLTAVPVCAFAQETGGSQAPHPESEAGASAENETYRPCIIAIAEISGGFYYKSTAQYHWGMAAMLRVARSPFPVEFGFRYDRFSTHSDGVHETFAIPVRVRHDWRVNSYASWDFIYGIDLGWTRQIKSPDDYNIGCGVWLGTGLNLHLTSRTSWGIGIELGYQFYDNLPAARNIFPMRLHTRVTF